MLSIEKMKQKDFPFAVELANTMNWNMTEADFAFNMQMEPNGCFVLKENEQVIGLATCISYGMVGWFGNLIVEEAHRKHGAGSMLVKNAMEYLHSTGVATVGLYAYKHLVNFYSNIGFKPDTGFLVLKAEEIVRQNTSENTLKNGTRTRRDITQMAELDKTCFGGSRSKLLERILPDKRNICYVGEEKGKVTGFAAAKVFNGFAEVGPLVCQRIEEKTAMALLSATLSRLEGSQAYMCVPSTETSLIEEASKFGFKEEFMVVRMFLGPPVQKDCIYIAESLERG